MNSPPPSRRIDSLDQFRGYTVLGMFLVNFVGGFTATHWVLKHHNCFCSYADTIMPQFFFAVGFAFRFTFMRRVEQLGWRSAYARVVRRLLALILIALVVYTAPRAGERWSELVELGFWGAIKVPLKRDWFQTLMHIAVTSLWVLPVIRASARVRLNFMVFSAAAHTVLSYVFYFAWVNTAPNGIDGGPLGFLTWTIPLIMGTLCADAFLRAGDHRPRMWPMVSWGVGLMALGYLISCGSRFYDVPAELRDITGVTKIAAYPVMPAAVDRERVWSEFSADRSRLWTEPPFVPPPHPRGDIGQSYQLRQWNYWMMSQRGGTLSYLFFSAGFSVVLFVVLHVFCDRVGWTVGILRTFGTNALAGYLLHMLVADSMQRFMPDDSPAWYVWSGCALFLTIIYVLIRGLERAGVYIRL